MKVLNNNDQQRKVKKYVKSDEKYLKNFIKNHNRQFETSMLIFKIIYFVMWNGTETP